MLCGKRNENKCRVEGRRNGQLNWVFVSAVSVRQYVVPSLNGGTHSYFICCRHGPKTSPASHRRLDVVVHLVCIHSTVANKSGVASHSVRHSLWVKVRIRISSKSDWAPTQPTSPVRDAFDHTNFPFETIGLSDTSRHLLLFLLHPSIPRERGRTGVDAHRHR